jgi:multidrug efflux pump subunit AcrB
VNRAIAWFAENHVSANLLMALILVGGLFTLPGIKQEVFPELDLPAIVISVAYPGASPSEVEEAICVRIEEELQGLQGIKRLHSTATENQGSVAVELLAGEDIRRRMDEIRARVDAIDTFPEEAEQPAIKQIDIRFQVVNVAVHGNVDEWTLTRLGQRARDEIAALPGITNVELVATRPYEISIEVPENALRRHGLAFDDIARAVRRSSLDLPGGSVKTDSGEILIRTRGQAYSGRDFENIVLVSRSDGTRFTLGQIANVVDGFEETDSMTLFDGQPSVLVQVFRVGDQSAIEIASTVRKYLDQVRDRLPEGVAFTLAQDDARFLRGRLDTLLRNGFSGFILVVLVLALFLRLRLALWVSLGIPLSFLGALWLLPSFDTSINLVSLMGFIVVLGIVVDDAIVVGENAHTEQERTGDNLGGAIRGAYGIATPVIFGVLTTVAAFAPMLFIPGPMGRMARVIPIVVIMCLAFSLLECLFILPAHLGYGTDINGVPGNPVSAAWRRFQDRVARGLSRVIYERYKPALARALEWRYLTASIGAAILMVTLGMLGGGWMKFVFQPDVEGEVAVAYVEMPQGTPVEITAAAVTQLADAAAEVAAEIDAERDLATQGSIFAHVSTSVGRQPYKLRQASGPSSFAAASATGSHLGEVQIEVVADELRSVSVEELTRNWRARSGEIIGAEELSFVSSVLGRAAPIDIELSGAALAELRQAAALLKKRLAIYPGVYDISDTFRGGKRELELELLPEAETLGLSVEDLGRQVRQAFYGQEIQRLQRGRDDVRVMVRYPAEGRSSLADLENMRIRTRDGSEVPFSTVASAELVSGFSTIKRLDRRRVVRVTAEVDSSLGNPNDIIGQVKTRDVPDIHSLCPDIRIDFGGEQREQREFLSSLGRGWIIALLVIYALLAVPLRSYSQPLIIMSAIPFGIVGAAWAHLALGLEFSMFSVIGLVALSGVVVNDSLVFVDCVNRKRSLGLDLHPALVEAGTARFRAILLTSLTTFAGLTPLLLETSVQARMLIPMAVSLAFGVIFATVITLFLVPAYYLILNDGLRALSGEPSPEPSQQVA